MLKRSVKYTALGLGIAALSFLYSGCAHFKFSKNSQQITQVNDYLSFTEQEFFTFEPELEIPKVEKVFSKDELSCVIIYDELKKGEFNWQTPSYVSLLPNRLEVKIIDELDRKESDSKGKYGLNIDFYAQK